MHTCVWSWRCLGVTTLNAIKIQQPCWARAPEDEQTEWHQGWRRTMEPNTNRRRNVKSPAFQALVVHQHTAAVSTLLVQHLPLKALALLADANWRSGNCPMPYVLGDELGEGTMLGAKAFQYGLLHLCGAASEHVFCMFCCFGWPTCYRVMAII